MVFKAQQAYVFLLLQEIFAANVIQLNTTSIIAWILVTTTKYNS